MCLSKGIWIIYDTFEFNQNSSLLKQNQNLFFVCFTHRKKKKERERDREKRTQPDNPIGLSPHPQREKVKKNVEHKML